MARWVLLWLGLFGVYVATLGIPALGTSDYAPAEARQLLTARSIADDGDVDLTNQYRARAYEAFYPYRLVPDGRRTAGRLDEPRALGFPLMIAPAYALGGARAVEVLLAAIAALAFVLAAALARRLVPEPWATAAPLVCALSPPALGYATAVTPELTAGALLAGASLLALRARDRPRRRVALACAVLLAPLPWLGLKFAIPGAVVLLTLLRWLLRRERLVPAFLAGEVVLASGVVFATVCDELYGGLTPYAAAPAGESATGAHSLGDHLGRANRLVALWLDRDYGLVRWAPMLALAFLGAWLLWRARRDRLARALPDVADVQAAGGLLAAIAAAEILVAAFLGPTMFGAWFPGRELIPALPAAAALAALGLRHAPRAGTALAAITLAGSAWLYLWLRLAGGQLVAPGTPAPWGPLERLLPAYAGGGSAWSAIVTVGAAAAVLALGARDWVRHRRTVEQALGA